MAKGRTSRLAERVKRLKAERDLRTLKLAMQAKLLKRGALPPAPSTHNVSPAEFLAKWSKVELSERASYQQHFLDLCALVGHETPAKMDPKGDFFCFERGAEVHGGGDGWADVWKKGHFGIEYKGKHKDLNKAYDQLLKYRASLENPPLLVVCDTDTIRIHTNFTGTAEKVHTIKTADIAEPRSIELLRAMFFDPEKLKPGITSVTVTKEAAGKLANLALTLRKRGLPATDIARFLDRVVFALFAEDVQLLPAKVFTTIVEKSYDDPARFKKLCGQLFSAMATGGDFGPESIRYFNGDLFTDAPVLDLTKEEIAEIAKACTLDWGAVDASIFGTLFQRGLDPETRAALGAEYTGREDIETLVEPVILAPLRAEWAAVAQKIHDLIDGKKGATLKAAITKADRLKHNFLERLEKVHVMDPACGSGNFLYVALQKLKDLEKEVILFGGKEGVGTSFFPKIGPWQFHGIEINAYAYELAQMTLWIGYLQWHRGNGFALTNDPVLKKLDTFHHHDALLDLRDPANPREWQWPIPKDVDVFIVGNPPFLGGKFLRRELGDTYVGQMLQAYRGKVEAQSDLCCYWFEKARALVESGKVIRVGLLATQGIRGGANREVLKKIKETGDIFFAVSDREWLLDGATVHISMVGFDAGSDPTRVLDGQEVSVINADLTSTAADVTTAREIDANKGLAFMGDTKVGAFDIPEAEARSMLAAKNPNGLPNKHVVRPWANGLDITRYPQGMWIIDFPPGTTEEQAALYEQPFEHIREHVKPVRAQNKRALYKNVWWIHAEPRPGMRAKLEGLPRFLATPTVSKHRIFSWLEHPTLPDHQLIAFARDDDYFFGVMVSKFHEIWARSQGSQLREAESGFRYTPTSCFETYAFPWPLNKPDSALSAAQKKHRDAIAAAAKNLNEQRQNWLGDRSDKKRTLTNLYNAKPAWLVNAHKAVDDAVAAAYGWPKDISDDDVLTKLLKMNHEQAPEAP